MYGACQVVRGVLVVVVVRAWKGVVTRPEEAWSGTAGTEAARAVSY